MQIVKVVIKGTKRGARVINGRSQSRFLVKLAGETILRRVYEDWTKLKDNGFPNNPKKWDTVPLVLLIKGNVTLIPKDQIAKHNLVQHPAK